MYITKDEINQIIEFLHNKNFSKAQIHEFIKKYRKYKNRILKLDESFDNYEKQMKKLNYNDEQIRILATRYPRAIFHKFVRGRIRKQYVNYLNNYQASEEKEINANYEYDEIIRILKSLGFSDEKIDYFFKVKAKIIFESPEVLQNRIDFYINNGKSKSAIHTVANKNIKFLELDIDDLNLLNEIAEPFGFDTKGFIDLIFSITKKSSSINLKNMLEVFKWFLLRDFDYRKIGIGLKKETYLFLTQTSNFDEGFKNIMELGFSEAETYKIVNNAITTLTAKKSDLQDKMDLLKDYNFGEFEIKKLILDFAGYFTMSYQNIKRKMDVISKWNLIEYIKLKPKNLIQSAELTECRAEYLSIYYPKLDYKVYRRYVFSSEQEFKDRFKKNNEELKMLLLNK